MTPESVASAGKKHECDVGENAKHPRGTIGGSQNVGSGPENQQPDDSNGRPIDTKLFGKPPERASNQWALGSQQIK
jgi:hypothetical protein